MTGLRAVPRWSVLSILLLLSGVLTTGKAQTPVTDFTYTNTDTAVTITGYTGPGGNVTIPDAIDGKPVTSIGNRAFYGCTNLTSVTIPDNVIILDRYVFGGCSGLTNIHFPNAVTTLGYGAFSGCSNLRNVAIPNGVTNIGDYVFYNCISLTEVTIPNSVTSLGSSTFAYCYGLTNVTLPNNITNIGDSMFAMCSNLVNITLPETTISIDTYAFYGCAGLTNIVISNSMVSIENMAFNGCTGLTNIAIPANMTKIGVFSFFHCANLMTIAVDPLNATYSSIDGVLFNKNQTILDKYPEGKTGDYAVPAGVTNINNSSFQGCIHLTKVTLPASITLIGAYAFSGCTNLTCVNIPDSVTKIQDQAFQGCSSLTHISIPANVTIIGGFYGADAFARCGSLLAIDVDAANTVYSSIEGVLFDKSQSTLLQCPGGKVGTCVIPSTVTSIRETAFAGCGGLMGFSVPANINYTTVDGVLFNKNQSTLIACPGGKTGSVEIPSTVQKMAGYAFSDCAGLTNISISPNITSISSNAFYNCSSLANIIIPCNVSKICDSAFYGCSSLTNITMPSKVAGIENYAFNNCTNLTGIYFEGNAPNYQFGSGDIFGYVNKVTVYYREGTTGWTSKYSGRPTALWNKADAPDFSYQQTGASYAIIGYVGAGGDITIPASIDGLPVTSIADYAFHYNYANPAVNNITSVVIPDAITNIGNGAFLQCRALTNVTISGSVTKIGHDVFYGCNALSSVTIQPGAAVIGPGMFRGCTNLVNITIPESVTTIGDAAFQGCISLTGVALPNSVSTIGSAVFADCSLLSNIALSESAGSIGSQCFSNCVALWNVVIPSGITNIESSAFYRCGSLTNVLFPEGLQTIKSNAFYYCGCLPVVSIPASVTNIESGAFGQCLGLKIMEFKGNAPAYAASDAFKSCPGTVYYHVGTTGWGTSLGGRLTAMVEYKFQILGSIATISQYTDSNSVVVIPDTIQDKTVGVIGGNAFLNNGLVAAVTVSDNVFKIDGHAFTGCTNLTNVVLGSGLTNIVDGAFYGCSSLRSITIPAGVSYLGSYVFANCTNLTSVYFEGNAPVRTLLYLFTNSPNVTVYYREGTKGWGATYAGQPTALWVEQPSYQDWAKSVGLVDKFPNASAEGDDADQDGMSNKDEMQAGTDPTSAASVLKFESTPRLGDLADEDKTAFGPDQRALYFQTVPGRKYEIQSANAVGGAWQAETNATAATTQKRVLVNKNNPQGFYRVVLVP